MQESFEVRYDRAVTLSGDAKRAYQRQWLKARRAAWFATQSCMECGRRDRLELHHLDPADKIDHKIWSWSAERRNAELAKCAALCENCHAVVSATQAKRKIPWSTVLEIRERYSTGESGMRIAADLGITFGYVYEIIRGECRKIC